MTSRLNKKNSKLEKETQILAVKKSVEMLNKAEEKKKEESRNKLRLNSMNHPHQYKETVIHTNKAVIQSKKFI